MRFTIGAAAALVLACAAFPAHAQVPEIVGTWAFNAEASRTAGPGPQSDIRSYRLTDDGVLIGLAVIVDAQGEPRFLQFAAKPDGGDYPEFSEASAAQYLIDGTLPPRTYSETPIGPRRVRWVDKHDGAIVAQGEKWVSEDGQTLSFTVEAMDENGEDFEYLYVFDRTGP